MKSFAIQLSEHNDGTTVAQATSKFSELLQAVQNSGRGGKYAITFTVSPSSRANSGSVDKVTITATHKLDLPKEVQQEDFYFLTDAGETSRNHPKQQSLELREVHGVSPLILKEVVSQ